jgi:hypothetical protein
LICSLIFEDFPAALKAFASGRLEDKPKAARKGFLNPGNEQERKASKACALTEFEDVH